MEIIIASCVASCSGGSTEHVRNSELIVSRSSFDFHRFEVADREVACLDSGLVVCKTHRFRSGSTASLGQSFVAARARGQVSEVKAGPLSM